MARPKSREGHYERIALDVREDLLFWLDALPESRRELIEEALVDLQAKKESERMVTQAAQRATLEKFLASDDFRAAVIGATKASWGGSGSRIELLSDGTWTVLAELEIGKLDETPGMLLRVPTLTIDSGEMEDYVKSGGGSQDTFLVEAFDVEEDELKAALREDLSDRLATLDAEYHNHVTLPPHK